MWTDSVFLPVFFKVLKNVKCFGYSVQCRSQYGDEDCPDALMNQLTWLNMTKYDALQIIFPNFLSQHGILRSNGKLLGHYGWQKAYSVVSLHSTSTRRAVDVSFDYKHFCFRYCYPWQYADSSCVTQGVFPSSAIKTSVPLPRNHWSVSWPHIRAMRHCILRALGNRTRVEQYLFSLRSYCCS